MARKRTINKSISISEQVNSLNLKAALLFTWMIPHADDFGILPGSPRKIKALVVPMRDDITVEDVEKALSDMAEAGLIYWYEYDGQQLIQFIKWDQHQSGLHKRTRSMYPTYHEVQKSQQNKTLPVGDKNSDAVSEKVVPDSVSQSSGNFPEFPGTSRNSSELPGNSGSREEKRTEENLIDNNLPSKELDQYTDTSSCINSSSQPKVSTTSNHKLPKYDSDSIEFALANQLRERILANLPTAKVPEPTPEKLRRWCHDINLMIRIDKRDPRQIADVIDWAQSNPFWMANILSPGKLRKKFDTLVLQMTRKGGYGGNGRGSPVATDDIEQFIIS